MELQTLKTIDVLTFDGDKGPITISVPVVDGIIQAEKMYQAIATSLGLSRDSLSHFRLCEGCMSPMQSFGSDDNIPGSIKDLSFQKWSFNTSAELQFCSNDEVAMKLVFLQTKAWVDQGWIKISEEEKSKLEDYLDPDFPLPNMYIKLCQGLEGYNSYHFDKCTAVFTDTTSSSKPSVINQDVPCSVILSLSSIAIVTDKKTQSIQWHSVLFWQLNPATSDVSLQYADSSSPGIVQNLRISTPQCRFMVDVIKGIVTHLQKTRKDSPKFHVSMISTLDNGSTRWENPLYREN